MPGAGGEFGGPVLPHASEVAFRPVGEFEATDGYNTEIRLWQACGRRVDPATGTDIEAAAASAVFAGLTKAIDEPAIHIRTDDSLVAAYLPGRGIHRLPPGTSVYEWDRETWNGFVLLPDGVG